MITLRAAAVALVPLGALAAGGGAHAWWSLPMLVAAAAAFLASGARVGSGDARPLDAALLALAGAVAIQLLPLPRGVLSAVSPQADAVRAAWSVDPASAPPTLSVDPRLTRAALASLASALLLFWAAREAFGRGGVRIAARAIVWAGFAVALLAAAERAAMPGLLPRIWTFGEHGSHPVGPFVNRNHCATWLLMGSALAAGYLVSHVRSLGPPAATLRLRIRDRLADGHGLVLAGALVSMVAALGATRSRAAVLGAGAAMTAALAVVPGSRFRVPGSCSGVKTRTGKPARGSGTRSREPGASTREAPGRGGPRLAFAGVAALLACVVWANRDDLGGKFDATPSAARVTIWRETLPVVRDFWAAGTGLGTYGPVMLRYQRTNRDVHFNQAHSEYLQVASEGGLLVIVPLLAAIAAAARLARRRLQEDTRVLGWMRTGAAAGLAGVAVQSLFETGLRLPANGLLAALLAAIVLHAPQAERR